MKPKTKQKAFLTELKDLFAKYGVQIILEDHGRNWVTDERITFEFDDYKIYDIECHKSVDVRDLEKKVQEL